MSKTIYVSKPSHVLKTLVDPVTGYKRKALVETGLPGDAGALVVDGSGLVFKASPQFKEHLGTHIREVRPILQGEGWTVRQLGGKR